MRVFPEETICATSASRIVVLCLTPAYIFQPPSRIDAGNIRDAFLCFSIYSCISPYSSSHPSCSCGPLPAVFPGAARVLSPHVLIGESKHLSSYHPAVILHAKKWSSMEDDHEENSNERSQDLAMKKPTSVGLKR